MQPDFSKPGLHNSPKLKCLAPLVWNYIGSNTRKGSKKYLPLPPVFGQFYPKDGKVSPACWLVSRGYWVLDGTQRLLERNLKKAIPPVGGLEFPQSPVPASPLEEELILRNSSSPVVHPCVHGYERAGSFEVSPPGVPWEDKVL